MKYKQWNIGTPRAEVCQAMTQASIPPLPAAVLCARGLDTPEKARAFLDDREELLRWSAGRRSPFTATTTWTASPPPAF